MSRSIRISTRTSPERKEALERACKATKWSESLILDEALWEWLVARGYIADDSQRSGEAS